MSTRVKKNLMISRKILYGFTPQSMAGFPLFFAGIMTVMRMMKPYFYRDPSPDRVKKPLTTPSNIAFMGRQGLFEIFLEAC